VHRSNRLVKQGRSWLARGQTIFERRFGQPPGVAELVKLWNNDLTTNLLRVVWTAYDQLHGDFLRHISWDENYDDLERSITQALEPAMQQVMDSFIPCFVQHSPRERESRLVRGQPPEYDIAFVWHEDRRIMWPLEAKVIQSDTDTRLADYIDTINQRYLQCRYAPFSNGGAMLGYLKAGRAPVVMHTIEVRLGQHLTQHPEFMTRSHKTSDHIRTVPSGKNYPIHFRCHHLILQM